MTQPERVFTDEDLKHFQCGDYEHLTKHELSCCIAALIARLEAAEKVIDVAWHDSECAVHSSFGPWRCDCEFPELLTEWRKAAGK